MKAIYSITLIILSFYSTVSYASFECDEEVYNQNLISLTDSILKDVLNRDGNAYENPLELIEHKAPMYCGSHTHMGTRYSVVSVEVTVDEYATEADTLYRVNDTCHISFTRNNNEWSGEQISCHEELGIEEDL